MSFTQDLLKDLRVVESAAVLAGPMVGMFFAELGAQVIKIENPKTDGDITRSWKLPIEDESSDVSAYFSSVNWGKKSIGLDLTNPDELKTALSIISNADIFMQNFKPGAEKKFSLDYETLSKKNPKLIYVQISAFGEDDNRPGFDAILQAETGFMGINGPPGGEPVKMPVALIDVLLAHQIKEAVLLALFEREKTGKGSFISSSLFQSGVASLANQSANYLWANSIPIRRGSDHPNISPYGTVFKTKDKKEIVIAAGTDKQFLALCRAINANDVINDERFSTNQIRVRYNEELKSELAKHFLKYERNELIKKFRELSIPAGAIRNMAEVFDLESAKRMLFTNRDSSEHELKGVGSISFNTNFIKKKKNLSPPPHFDQHRKEILEIINKQNYD